MKTYNGLRNLCMFVTMATLVFGLLGGAYGAVILLRGNLAGLVYILTAFASIILIAILSGVVSVLIDIALALQQLSAQTDNLPNLKLKKQLPPQLEK